MNTDHPIDLFPRGGPEAFRVLTGGLRLEGAYTVCSLTLKSLERRIDGLVAPDGHAGPAYVVEFQAQPVPKSPKARKARVRSCIPANSSTGLPFPMTSEPTNTAETADKARLREWHRAFGIALVDVFAGAGCLVAG
ncbi:DUF2887 domain-containing protein [Halochromatium roseum]|uniref:DUF2887 domain-containing protein n=1 Tax=Halochromatium roseum TaxID=391920 RepID=UPI0030843176